MANIQSTRHLCSKHAIFMQDNAEGLSYPKVDAGDMKRSVDKVYVAQLRDKSILKKSSSGGVLSLIEKYVVESEGIVFGVAGDERLQLHLIGVEMCKNFCYE